MGNKQSDMGEKKAFGIIKHIPIVGNAYSAVRAPIYLAKGQRCEAARSGAGILLGGIPILAAGDEIAKAIERANAGRWLGKRILYHSTSKDAGEKIYQSKTMRGGVDGVLGRGIYFAEDEHACRQKALNFGAMVKAEVDLGKCLCISKGCAIWRMLQDGGWGEKKLKNAGISSVRCDFNGGPEYCVFDPNRVKVLHVSYKRGPQDAQGSKRRR